MRKPWSLYNKEDKLRVDDLTPEQVRVVLLTTASSRMHHWYACQEGDLHWQPISAIPEFYEDVRQIKGPKEEEDRDKEVTESVTMRTSPASPPASPPAAPTPAVQKPQAPRRPLFEDMPEEATAPTLQIENVRTKERRTARRYERRLGFKITGEGGQIFQSHTSDISMAGIALEDALPNWVQKTFTAELSQGKHTIKVMCSKVDDRKMKLKDSSSWDVIRAWIVNW